MDHFVKHCPIITARFVLIVFQFMVRYASIVSDESKAAGLKVLRSNGAFFRGLK